MLHEYSIAKKSTYLLYSFSVFGLNTKGREAFTAPRPNLSIIPGRPTPQKGMTRKNHHDDRSQSGKKDYGYSEQTRQSKYTISGVTMGSKRPPKSNISASSFGSSNTSNSSKPFKSF